MAHENVRSERSLEREEGVSHLCGQRAQTE